MESNGKLWSPSPAQISEAALTAFAKAASQRAGRPFAGYSDLHRWSIGDRAGFWNLVWDFCGVIGDTGRTRADRRRQDAGRAFFPDATLNFAENLLGRSGDGRGDRLPRRGQGRAPAVLGRIAGAGLAPAAGDARARRRRRATASRRCCPTCPRRSPRMLAAASIGAIWSSCSPDFGVRGRARPLRPDRARAVHRRRRLLVQRQAERRRRTR